MTSYTAMFVERAMKAELSKLEKAVEDAAEDIDMETEMDPAARRYIAALEELLQGYRAVEELRHNFD